MNRTDILSFERFYAATFRREASKRRKSSPAVAAQLDRWAQAADHRADAIRCGPLFDSEKGLT